MVPFNNLIVKFILLLQLQQLIISLFLSDSLFSLPLLFVNGKRISNIGQYENHNNLIIYSKDEPHKSIEIRKHPDSFQDNNGDNHLYNDVCSSSLTLDDVSFDLSPLQFSLLSYDYNNSTFYINLCSNYSSPCSDDNIVCQVNSDGSIFSLAFGSTVKYSSSGVAGFTLWYFGQPCDTSKSQDFNTSVSLLCDSSTEYQVMDIKVDSCDTTIYIKSKYACGTYSDGTRPTFNLIIFFSTLFGTILMFICVAGCIYSASRLFGRFLRRNIHNTYPPLLGSGAGGSGVSITSISEQGSPMTYKHEIIDNNISINDGNGGSSSSSNNNNTTQNNNICKICFENKIDTVLLDCGHYSLCLTCTEKVNRCPICRGPIKKVVKIYQV